MSKSIKSFFSGLLMLNAVSVNGALAQELNVCDDPSTTVAYFNGVLTGNTQAQYVIGIFESILGDTDANGQSVQFELLYNQTHGFSDLVEAFAQRLEEQEGVLQERFELFTSALRGGGTWWDSITEVLPATAQLLNGFADTIKASVPGMLASLAENAPMTQDYIEHQTRIDNWHIEGKKLLFVAHSQGNLFANAAYNYAIDKGRSADTTKVVHIAPASPQLNGSHVLADQDVVINGLLRLLGTVPTVTNNIPFYSERPAGLNGETDILGHGLLEIYLNPNLAISSSVKNHIFQALNSLEQPERQAESGFLTATLTWDGAGDVDLHAYEPSGEHVYYAHKNGFNGKLDVDNTQAYGPEHYVISCEREFIDTGSYRIAVANFARATGRKATVQLASAADGVLATETVALSSPTGSTPGYTIFNVEVEQNPDTQRYTVKLKN